MIAALASDADDQQSAIEYSDMAGAVVAPNLVLLTLHRRSVGASVRRCL